MLSCNVELDPVLVNPQNSVMVTWRFGTFEVFSDNFLTVSPLVGDGRTYQRNLTFQTLFLSDTGSFVCEATVVTIGGNTSASSSTVHLSVEGMCMHELIAVRCLTDREDEYRPNHPPQCPLLSKLCAIL